MKNLSFFWILPLAALGFIGGMSYGQNDQIRKDIDSHLADMRQTEAKLDAAKEDFDSAKHDQAVMLKRAYSPDAMQVLRARIEKDRSDIEAYTAQMLSDLTFLQNQWASLSEVEKDTVTRASKSLE